MFMFMSDTPRGRVKRTEEEGKEATDRFRERIKK